MFKGIIRYIMKKGVAPVKVHPVAGIVVRDSVATVLEDFPPSPVKHKSLSNLTEFYQSGQNYTGLVLKGQNIDDNQSLKFFKSIAGNRNLEYLVLSRNAITEAGIKGMSSFLAGNMLRTIKIEGNSIGDIGSFEVASILEGSKVLQELNVSNNKIGPDGAIALARALKVNTSLEDLSIDGNSIGDKGISALAESLRSNSTLQYLRCDSNEIADSGAIDLAISLPQGALALSYLSLNNNQITDSGAEEFSEVLRRSLQLKIKLRGNYISGEVEGRFKDEFGMRVELADQKLSLDAMDFGYNTWKCETQNLDVYHKQQNYEGEHITYTSDDEDQDVGVLGAVSL
jgi:Leucine-rich repeat (LRR) protein